MCKKRCPAHKDFGHVFIIYKFYEILLRSIVQGVRHNAVIFAETLEEAIAQAAEQDLVGDWEGPEAIEDPRPEATRLLYDPKHERKTRRIMMIIAILFSPILTE